MLVEVEGGKVRAVSGDNDNPDSQGFLCVSRRSTNEISPHITGGVARYGQRPYRA